jgi:hypothetical protein
MERGDPLGELYTLQSQVQKRALAPAKIASGMAYANRRAYSIDSGRPRNLDTWSRMYALLHRHALGGDVRGAMHGFHHAFVEAIAIDAADFVPRMDAIFAAAPLKYLRLRNVTQATAEAVSANPHMKRVRLLVIGGPISKSVDRVLDDSKNLAATTIKR